MKFFLSTSLLASLLPQGLAATKSVFDVSRSSRITCQTKNDGCTLEGDFGAESYQGFSDRYSANDSVYRSDGKEDSYLELSSCWEFDCKAECDSSCSCVNIATNKACPVVGDAPAVLKKRPAFNLQEPHVFQNLQDVRLACTESHTKCVVSGFEGCGYSVPQYNLYNDLSGLFLVEDVSKGDTEFEIRACNPVLGTAECDAGCTCHDLATNEPCDFTVLPPHPVVPPVSPPAPKIVFSGLTKATFTCGVQNARCDEIHGLNICGGTTEGETELFTTSDISYGAALRVDHVNIGANSVQFSACSYDTPFSMECDSGCTCIDANTQLACSIQEKGMFQRLVKHAAMGLLVLSLFFCVISRLSSGIQSKPRKAEYSLVENKDIEIISVTGDTK